VPDLVSQFEIAGAGAMPALDRLRRGHGVQAAARPWRPAGSSRFPGSTMSSRKERCG
jgi:hypothetical protein